MTISPVPEIRPFQSPEHLPFRYGDGPGGILMIHGFGGTPAELRGLGERLVQAGWHTRALLLPGFGPDIVNLDQRHPQEWYAAVQAEWQALQAQHNPCVLLGFSMGAAVALNLESLLKPSRLILAAPFWHIPAWIASFLPVMRWITPRVRPFRKANFADLRVRQFFEKLMPGIDLDDPAVQNYVRTELFIPLKLINEIARMGKNAYHHARSVNTPTLIIQGNQDNVVSPAATRRLAQRLPAPLTVYREIPGAHDFLPKSYGYPSDDFREHLNQVHLDPVTSAILDWLPPVHGDHLYPVPNTTLANVE
jgi:carboxylesterase